MVSLCRVTTSSGAADEPIATGTDGPALVRLLKSFTHPLRIRMFYALTARNGSATATQLAEDIGTTPQLAYYHLSIMGKLGILEEDDDAPARGRERYWRHAKASLAFDIDELGQGSEAQLELLHRTQAAAHAEMLQQFFASGGNPNDPFRRAAFGSDMILTVSLAQFEKFQHEMTELLMRYRDASSEKASDAQHVFALVHAFPMETPGTK